MRAHSLEQLEHLRQAAPDVAAPAVLRPDRVGDCGEPAGRIEEDERVGEGRPEVHIPEDGLGIGDAPRVVERGLEDYAAPEELARREAAPGVLDVARHLGVDPEEDVHVRRGRVRRLGIPGPRRANEDRPHQLRDPGRLLPQPRLGDAPRFTRRDHDTPIQAHCRPHARSPGASVPRFRERGAPVRNGGETNPGARSVGSVPGGERLANVGVARVRSIHDPHHIASAALRSACTPNGQ